MVAEGLADLRYPNSNGTIIEDGKAALDALAAEAERLRVKNMRKLANFAKI